MHPEQILQGHHFWLLECWRPTKAAGKQIYEIEDNTAQQFIEGNVTMSVTHKVMLPSP
jgi:hypothetical protein